MEKQDRIYTEEDYLFEQIRLLRESYEKAAKPYIDRLVYLKSINPQPIIVSREAYEAARQNI